MERWDGVDHLGFDQTTKDEDSIVLGCSQCQATFINHTPCHETGCPNQTRECDECGDAIPRRQRVCESCAEGM